MCSLQGIRIVVTRAAHQAEELAEPLRALGSEVLLVPVIGIAGPSDPAPLREAAAACDRYDWIIFTSVNAVTAFAAELPGPRRPGSALVATIGEATRRSAEQNGFRVSMMPEKYVAESLTQAMRAHPLAGKRVLIPRAAVARDVVPDALRALGAQVNVVEAYRNVVPLGAAGRVREVFREPFPDWTTFASPSAVENLVKLAGVAALRRVRIATIGPVTSETVREYGLSVAAEAQVHSVPGLVKALCFSSSGSSH